MPKIASLLIQDGEAPKVCSVVSTLPLTEKARMATLHVHRTAPFKYFLVGVENDRICGVVSYTRKNTGGTIVPSSALTIGTALQVDDTVFQVGTQLANVATANVKPHIAQLIRALN